MLSRNILARHYNRHIFYQKRSFSRSTIKERINELSKRTGTDPISLGASFAILHEITAILPIFLIFGGLHYAGVGERSLEYIWDNNAPNDTTRSYIRSACEEGERRLDRIREKYNLWRDDDSKWDGRSVYTAQISEAIAAYAITKVSLSYIACIVTETLSSCYSRLGYSPAYTSVLNLVYLYLNR